MKYLIPLLITLALFTTPALAQDKMTTCSNLQDAVKAVVLARNDGADRTDALNLANSLPSEIRSAMKELINAVWNAPKHSLNPQAVSEKVFISCYFG